MSDFVATVANIGYGKVIMFVVVAGVLIYAFVGGKGGKGGKGGSTPSE